MPDLSVARVGARAPARANTHVYAARVCARMRRRGWRTHRENVWPARAEGPDWNNTFMFNRNRGACPATTRNHPPISEINLLINIPSLREYHVREIDEPSIEYLGVLFFLLLPLLFFFPFFFLPPISTVRRSGHVALRTIARQTYVFIS